MDEIATLKLNEEEKECKIEIKKEFEIIDEDFMIKEEIIDVDDDSDDVIEIDEVEEDEADCCEKQPTRRRRRYTNLLVSLLEGHEKIAFSTIPEMQQARKEFWTQLTVNFNENVKHTQDRRLQSEIKKVFYCNYLFYNKNK